MLQSHSIELSHEPGYYERGLRVAPKTEKRATLRVRRRGKAAAGTARDSSHPVELPLAISPAQSETGEQNTVTP
jgi:hypothetical protein